MSRSKRHTPIIGFTTVESEKWNKRFWSRSLRVRLRNALSRGDEVMPIPVAEYGEKDGHQRFDPVKHPRLMRK